MLGAGLHNVDAGQGADPRAGVQARPSAVSDDAARSASIRGQAFVITIRGVVIYAVGARVSLVPVTPATSRWYERVGKYGQRVPARELHFSPLARTVSTDDEGLFEFTGLRPGDYYLVSHLAPGVHTGYAMVPGGIVLHNQASVAPGESRKVMLTVQMQPGVGFH
jgi:hypothetical protein